MAEPYTLRGERSRWHEYEHDPGARIADVLADRGCPLRDIRGRTGQLAAPGARWRIPVRRKPVARADRARSRRGYTPDPGPPGPGATAPGAAHATGHRPLVLIVHRTGAHPQQAGPAYSGLLPGRRSPA